MNKDDEFIFLQQIEKAVLRVREKRALPIDLILLNLDWRLASVVYVVDDVGLIISLLDEVSHSELDIIKMANADFYDCLLQIKEVSKKSNLTVDEDVKEHLTKLNLQELHELMSSVQNKAGDYWRIMEKHVYRQISILRLEQCHHQFLLNRSKLSSVEIVGRECLAAPRLLQCMREGDLEWERTKSDFMPNCQYEALTAAPSENPPNYVAFILKTTRWTRLNERRHDTLNPPPQSDSGISVLIDYRSVPQNATPSYSLSTPSEGHRMLTISSSPTVPYTSLCFTIPDHPWECNARQGFHCSFENGFLTLKARFKRYF